ncbi:hypothetical protein ACRBEV_33120 (plasmid) [Methylobacterium phyllosphaerae]
MRPIYRGQRKEAIEYVPVYETGVQEMIEARASPWRMATRDKPCAERLVGAGPAG